MWVKKFGHTGISTYTPLIKYPHSRGKLGTSKHQMTTHLHEDCPKGPWRGQIYFKELGSGPKYSQKGLLLWAQKSSACRCSHYKLMSYTVPCLVVSSTVVVILVYLPFIYLRRKLLFWLSQDFKFTTNIILNDIFNTLSASALPLTSKIVWR
jgi:hypothetical protein